jgi:hypothetical protein
VSMRLPGWVKPCTVPPRPGTGPSGRYRAEADVFQFPETAESIERGWRALHHEWLENPRLRDGTPVDRAGNAWVVADRAREAWGLPLQLRSPSPGIRERYRRSRDLTRAAARHHLRVLAGDLMASRRSRTQGRSR